MGRFIVKMERDDKVRYMEWSTIVDAPVTYLMPLEEFKAYYQEEHGRRSVEFDFEDRMKRVEAKGVSSHVSTYAGLWEYNRAGDDETQLTEEQTWVKYHDWRATDGEDPATHEAREEPPRPKRGDLWKHYKGTVYFIEGEAKHSETEQTMILYRPNNGSTHNDEGAQVWARPLSMWHDDVGDGKRRFEPVT
jgi:hypothetical protein